MVATTEALERPRSYAAPPGRNGAAPARPPRVPLLLAPWLDTQAINVARHAAALRPFRRGEFGTGAAAPTEGHLQAVNALVNSLRTNLLALTQQVTDAADRAIRDPATSRLQHVV